LTFFEVCRAKYRSFCFVKPLIFSLKARIVNTKLTTYFALMCGRKVLKIGSYSFSSVLYGRLYISVCIPLFPFSIFGNISSENFSNFSDLYKSLESTNDKREIGFSQNIIILFAFTLYTMLQYIYI